MVVGRIITSQLIIFSRRRRISHHRTMVIGGGPTAAELIRILKEHQRYGLSVVGFVEDTDDCAAGPVAQRLGNIADLDFVVTRRRVDVLLVADSATPERTLVKEVRAPASSKCDLLVVPRMHQFRTESGRVGPHRVDPDHADRQPAAERPGHRDQASLRHPRRRASR